MRTSPPKFHIHIDAADISPAVEARLVHDFAFGRKNFEHDGEVSRYAPARHLSRNDLGARDFRPTFERVQAVLEGDSRFVGYIEGEFVEVDEPIAERPYNSVIAIPFRVVTQPLVAGTFREDEIHVTMDEERSSAQLQDQLRAAGLFHARMRKPACLTSIWTVQGSRVTIGTVLPLLRQFLSEAGGSVTASIKRERTARWWTRGTLSLPPVIAMIIDTQ